MSLVKVDHTGSCMDYSYQADEPVELPEEVIAAIGVDHVTPVKEVKKEVKTAPNKQITGAPVTK